MKYGAKAGDPIPVEIKKWEAGADAGRLTASEAIGPLPPLPVEGVPLPPGLLGFGAGAGIGFGTLSIGGVGEGTMVLAGSVIYFLLTVRPTLITMGDVGSSVNPRSSICSRMAAAIL